MTLVCQHTVVGVVVQYSTVHVSPPVHGIVDCAIVMRPATNRADTAMVTGRTLIDPAVRAAQIDAYAGVDSGVGAVRYTPAGGVR